MKIKKCFTFDFRAEWLFYLLFLPIACSIILNVINIDWFQNSQEHNIYKSELNLDYKYLKTKWDDTSLDHFLISTILSSILVIDGSLPLGDLKLKLSLIINNTLRCKKRMTHILFSNSFSSKTDLSLKLKKISSRNTTPKSFRKNLILSRFFKLIKTLLWTK